MVEIRIENWSLVESDDPYCPPEYRWKMIRGEVFGYPGRPDGDKVQSSPIVQSLSKGTLVVTKSGKSYRLGTISADYLKWLENEGYIYNPDEPIAFGKQAPRRG